MYDRLDRQTVASSIAPLKRGTGDLQFYEPAHVGDRFWLLPGDLGLSDIEDELVKCWSDRRPARTGVPRHRRTPSGDGSCGGKLRRRIRVDRCRPQFRRAQSHSLDRRRFRGDPSDIPTSSPCKASKMPALVSRLGGLNGRIANNERRNWISRCQTGKCILWDMSFLD